MIEPLSKDNYDSWRLQMEALLVKTDALPYVEGAILKPEPESGASNALGITTWNLANRSTLGPKTWPLTYSPKHCLLPNTNRVYLRWGFWLKTRSDNTCHFEWGCWNMAKSHYYCITIVRNIKSYNVHQVYRWYKYCIVVHVYEKT